MHRIHGLIRSIRFSQYTCRTRFSLILQRIFRGSAWMLVQMRNESRRRSGESCAQFIGPWEQEIINTQPAETSPMQHNTKSWFSSKRTAVQKHK